MQARDLHWYRVCQHTYPSAKRILTAAEILGRAGYGSGQFRLCEGGRHFRPDEPVLVNGREFDVEFTGA